MSCGDNPPFWCSRTNLLGSNVQNTILNIINKITDIPGTVVQVSSLYIARSLSNSGISFKSCAWKKSSLHNMWIIGYRVMTMFVTFFVAVLSLSYATGEVLPESEYDDHTNVSTVAKINVGSGGESGPSSVHVWRTLRH